MFNLLRKINRGSETANKKETTSIRHSSDFDEIPTASNYYDSSSFSPAIAYEESDINTAYETSASKNKTIRSQEWLTDLEEATRAQIGDFRFSVEMLASEMALSRSQLFRRVKDLLGISPNKFIRDIRLKVAKELLESGRQHSVKATAFEVGLKDIVHFSRLFKEKYGFLPSDYI